MRCKKANILLSAFIDEELGKRETASVKTHIEKCSRCREKLGELEEYKRLAIIIEKKTAPAGFTEAVLLSIGKEPHSSNAKNTGRQSTGRVIFWAAAAVMAILITVTLIPFDIFYPDIIETNYYTEAQKGGKGPPGETRGEKKDGKGAANNPDESFIRNLVEEHGGSIKSVSYSGETGKPCRIEISIPSVNFLQFRTEYNNARKRNPVPDVDIKKSGKNIPVVISFPMRTFIAGDFNADGFDDIIVYMNKGNKSGDFVIAPNDSGGNFGPPVSIPAGERARINSASAKIVSGDFNADGFDDILIFENQEGKFKLSLLKNIKGRKFKKAWNFDLRTPDLLHQDKLFLLCGDINGDGMDDIIFHQRNQSENGVWWLSLNLGTFEFDEASLIGDGHTGWEKTSSYLPFICDINGDGLYETGMYGKGGERDARWYVSVNNGNSGFRDEQLLMFGSSGMAYQGDYFPLFGDFDGDGLTDILVKYGSPDLFSNWYMMFNRDSFQFSYGSDVHFNGEKDFDY